MKYREITHVQSLPAAAFAPGLAAIDIDPADLVRFRTALCR